MEQYIQVFTEYGSQYFESGGYKNMDQRKLISNNDMSSVVEITVVHVHAVDFQTVFGAFCLRFSNVSRFVKNCKTAQFGGFKASRIAVM
jgi:hypothetical protein